MHSRKHLPEQLLSEQMSYSCHKNNYETNYDKNAKSVATSQQKTEKKMEISWEPVARISEENRNLNYQLYLACLFSLSLLDMVGFKNIIVLCSFILLYCSFPSLVSFFVTLCDT